VIFARQTMMRLEEIATLSGNLNSHPYYYHMLNHFVKTLRVLTYVPAILGHTERVWFCAWSPTGNQIATCSGDTTVRVWCQEGDKWVCQQTLEDAHERTVRSCSWSPDGSHLASSSFDATTAIWEVIDGGEDNKRRRLRSNTK